MNQTSTNPHNTFEKRLIHQAEILSDLKDESLALSIIRAYAASRPAIQRQAVAERLHLYYLELQSPATKEHRVLQR